MTAFLFKLPCNLRWFPTVKAQSIDFSYNFRRRFIYQPVLLVLWVSDIENRCTDRTGLLPAPSGLYQQLFEIVPRMDRATGRCINPEKQKTSRNGFYTSIAARFFMRKAIGEKLQELSLSVFSPFPFGKEKQNTDCYSGNQHHGYIQPNVAVIASLGWRQRHYYGIVAILLHGKYPL